MTTYLKKQKINLKQKALETSKVIVLATGVIFVVHIVLSTALICFGYGENAIALMAATMPIYLAVVAGYFGKAGVENFQKIKNLSENDNNYSNG
jgi:hypothetical protein